MSFHQKLSRLRPAQVAKILGPKAPRLLALGGIEEIDIGVDVEFSGDVLRLRLGGGIVATLLHDPQAPEGIRPLCSHCKSPCEHVGAALSLVLEEKTALGLATAAPKTKPTVTPTLEELESRELARRAERAEREPLKVRSLDPDEIWSDHLVTNRSSGRTYRVSLRGWEAGESYCSCPDFRKNTLGTCKHILHVAQKTRRRFPSWKNTKPYDPIAPLLVVRYGADFGLRVLLPKKPSPAAKQLLGSFLGRRVDEVRELVGAISHLAQVGEEMVVYPDARELLDLELNRLRLAGLVQQIRKDPKHHPLRKSLLRIELLPYQLDGIAFCAGAGRAVLADDMGLGKTIQGVGTAELLARENGISRVLVVCPASVKGQWKSEIERFCDRSVRVVAGSAASRAEEYQQTAFFTVCNYEQVVRDLRHIQEIPWDLVILDEGQRIKNWEAKTTRTLKSIPSRFRLVLSGTPLENRLEELHSVVEFVDDRRLGPDYLFRHRHVVALEGGRTEGYRNLDELRKALHPILLRRTRAQVLAQLPERTDEVLRVPPSQEQLAIHESSSRVVLSIIHKPHLTEMDLLRLQKAMLVCRMVADSTTLVDKKEPGHSTKLERLAELLPALAREPDRKVIVFSEWTSMLDLVERRILKPEGLDFVRLDGSVPQSKRPALVRRFQIDPACRFFLSSNAGTTGLNLQAADTVVNIDLPWNPAVLEQRIARAHRMGQKRPVHVYLLVTEKTMEEGMLQTLGNKRRMGQAALDFESDVLAVDLSSGIDELKGRLETILIPSEVPIDESQRSRELARAQELSDAELDRRRRELQTTGGQLLVSAFGFVGQLASRDGSPDPATADAIRRNLSDCLVANEDGSQELRLRLPDPSSFEALVRSLALLATGLAGPIPPPR